jgi:hypothetical protein
MQVHHCIIKPVTAAFVCVCVFVSLLPNCSSSLEFVSPWCITPGSETDKSDSQTAASQNLDHARENQTTWKRSLCQHSFLPFNSKIYRQTRTWPSCANNCHHYAQIRNPTSPIQSFKRVRYVCPFHYTQFPLSKNDQKKETYLDSTMFYKYLCAYIEEKRHFASSRHKK